MKGKTFSFSFLFLFSFLFFPAIFLLFSPGLKPAMGCELKDVKISSGTGRAECVLVTSGKVDFQEHALSKPQRVYVDLLGSNLKRGLSRILQRRLKAGGIVSAVRVAQFDRRTVRVVFEFNSTPNVSITRPSGKKNSGLVLDFSEGFNGDESKAASHPGAGPSVKSGRSEIAAQINRIRTDVLNGLSGAPSHELPSALAVNRRGGSAKEKEIYGALAKKVAPSASASFVNNTAPALKNGNRNNVLAAVSDVRRRKPSEDERGGPFPFNKWRVVIDPGHGGKDPGTSGTDGQHEKQYTLAIARRLAGILGKDPHYEVFLTRDKDKFITLDNRTLMANRVQADIFVSIHINWSSDSATRGITTYFLNWTNDAEANRVAARENQISMKRQKQARSQLGYILASLQLEGKRDGSLRLANYIEDSVSSNVREYHPNEPGLGVKEALFYVLVGDKMPAALVEVSFLSNPKDEELLEERSYIDEVAQGIADGIGDYFRSVPVRALRAMAQSQIYKSNEKGKTREPGA